MRPAPCKFLVRGGPWGGCSQLTERAGSRLASPHVTLVSFLPTLLRRVQQLLRMTSCISPALGNSLPPPHTPSQGTGKDDDQALTSAAGGGFETASLRRSSHTSHLACRHVLPTIPTLNFRTLPSPHRETPTLGCHPQLPSSPSPWRPLIPSLGISAGGALSQLATN